MRLLDLPDDLHRCILQRCSTRALLCAASTCRHLRALAAETRLPVVTLTDRQRGRAKRWMLGPGVAGRVHTLVIRRCVHDRLDWAAGLTGLTSLTLAFCRVRSHALAVLPPGLLHLDVHMVTPPYGSSHDRVRLGHLKRLRTLRLVFTPCWVAAFLRALPPGLRVLHVRGADALVVEAFMPRGLRDVRLGAATMLLCCNRLPPRVGRVHLDCSDGRVWLRDTLPRDLRRLRHLEVRSPTTCWLPRASEMTSLRTLRLHTDTFVSDWRALAGARHLDDLEIGVKRWLGYASLHWPSGCRVPRRVVVTIAGVRVPAPSIRAG